jgi:alpha-aminoadipic semialdehyde synthase
MKTFFKILVFDHLATHDRNKDKKTFKGPGVLICSIDNMPTQMPREATDFFGDLLFPHVLDILKSDATQELDETEIAKLGPVVSNAVITSNGKLTPNFQYIDDLRKSQTASTFQTMGDFKGVERKVKALLTMYACEQEVYLIRDFY